MTEEEQVESEAEATLQEKIDMVKAQEGQDLPLPDFESADYAPKFQKWIDTYERDVTLFKDVLTDIEAPEPLRRLVCGGLMYLIRQFDLVPDSMNPLGIIDDTMVLRVVADLSAEYTAELEPKKMKAMFKLANDTEAIKGFVGNDYRDLENYVRLIPEQPTKGKTAQDILEHGNLMREFLGEVDEELRHFEAKQIDDPEKVERKLHSYLTAKLSKKK